jgi:hypothetical protein
MVGDFTCLLKFSFQGEDVGKARRYPNKHPRYIGKNSNAIRQQALFLSL